MSDELVIQYSDKTMFYVMATTLTDRFPNVGKIIWNYKESGHSKGATDGIEVTIKKTADTVGDRTENLEKFVEASKRIGYNN